MTRYEQLVTRLTGIAYILAPTFFVLGAAAYLLGIARSPDGTSSWVEGIFMAWGTIVMVPVLLDLARRLGERAPKLALFCTITAPCFAFTLVPAVARIWQVDLIAAGLNQSVWAVGMQHSGWTPLILGSALGLFTPIFLGSGFLWQGGIPRSSAILLLAAPILLLIGQGGDETIAWWQVSVVYPISTLVWLAALVPLGWNYLTSGTLSRYTSNPATA